jgi:endo-1,4-beta-xylanase
MRLVRSRAGQWNIKPDRIGIAGFSAGGDLVLATTGASDTGDASAADPIDRVSSRPDFQVPIYAGGLDQSPPNTSNDTPPTLLIAAVDDRDSIAIGSAELYLALRKASVPVELHIYGSGGHGFGLRPGDRAVDKWPERLVDWLGDIGMTDN